MGKRRSGPEVLSEINEEIESVRTRIAGLSNSISDANTDIEKLRQDEANSYLELAKVRFELIEDEDSVNQLSRMERQATSYLGERQKARRELDIELTKNQKEQKSLDKKRALILDKLDDFVTKVKTAESKTLKKLETHDLFLAKLSDVEETEQQIARIENKIVVAEEDYLEKVKPYQDDPLFMYLWEKGYKTSEYKAGNISRLMDRWVARICKYEPARRNYATLIGIPEKLKLHKTHLEEKVEYLTNKIVEIEQELFQKDGVTLLQEQLQTKKTDLDSIDTKLVSLENRYEKILAEKERFSSNTDQFYSGAISELKELYASNSLYNLRRNAAVTTTKEDDAIVQNLFEIEDRIEHIEEDISEYQSSLRQEQWRLKEVQNMRQTFKDKKYDSRRTTIRDGNMFTILLGQFVTGIITNTYFWSMVGRLCMEVLDELDLDDVFEDMGRGRKRSRYRKSRSSSPWSRSRSKSKGGFRTGGRF